MPLTAVLFDLDDTLLWDERSVEEAMDTVCKEGSEASGADADLLKEAVRREARALYMTYETFPFTQMIGINPFEALWGHFTKGDHPMFRRLQELAPSYRIAAWTRALASLGVDDPALGEKLAEMFPRLRRQLPYVYEETFDVLRSLHGSYKLLLLTNGSPDLQQEKLDGVPDLIPYFDSIIISGQFGEGKPSERLFRHALETIGVSADEAIMVGDKLTTDIKGANGVGMRSVWINHHGARHSDDIVPTYEITRLSELMAIIRSISAS